MSKTPCFKEQFLEGRACPLPTTLLQDHSDAWQPQADARHQRQRLGSITASLSRNPRGSSGLWISLARLCPHTRDCLPTLMTTLLGRSITKYRKTGSRWPPALQGMSGLWGTCMTSECTPTHHVVSFHGKDTAREVCIRSPSSQSPSNCISA